MATGIETRTADTVQDFTGKPDRIKKESNGLATTEESKTRRIKSWFLIIYHIL
ncbi:MAG TPA: hypothetical protein VE593_06980 [Nitrososphaeraceae archaeon]|nr:hypothetical protein [Nitrososphaeraceae archaeon]